MEILNKKNRILFVHDYPPTEGGGIEVNVFKTAKELVARGHSATICTSRYASETYKTNELEKVVHGISIELLESTQRLQELITNSDIVHIYFTFSCRVASLEALKFCVENNKPCVFSIRTSHKHIPFSSIGSMFPLERDSKLNFIRQYLMSDCVTVSGPASCIQDSVAWLGVNKNVKVIPNGTDFHGERHL